EGYHYIGNGSPTPTMTAMGLLCRQHLQSWGPKTPQLVKAVEKHLKPMPPGQARNMYYYYHATQVMFGLGGPEWTAWNRQMRDDLVKREEMDGSWDPSGDVHANAGGRLLETSLSLLTLEVYYRYPRTER